MVARNKSFNVEFLRKWASMKFLSLPGMVVVVEFVVVVVELVVWLRALPLYCLVYLHQTYQGQANLQMLKYGLGLG